MFTDEQQAIIDSMAFRIRVIAFAGTGKTSTLVGYARARKTKMLYLAYNKAIQMAASARLPANVSCRTTHSLAYAVIGRQYAHKLGSMRVGDVAEELRLSFVHASMALATLNSYFYSADDEIGPALLPADVNRNHQMDVHAVLAGANTLWQYMQDKDDRDVPMSHDGYLKLYALSRPTLPGECVLLDEAQDANPVTTSIILAHQGPLVMTGDPFQSIYSFRGSRDALGEMQDAETFYLTRSFRFGKGVARVANHLLDYLGEPNRVEGAGQYPDTRTQVDRDKPFAVITRTNMVLIQAAIQTIGPKLRSYYVGGVENIKLDLIADGYALYCRSLSKIEDRFIKKFTSLAALSEYATKAKDAEMALLCRLVVTYTHAIPQILKDIRALAVDAITDAQRIFSTAHRCKGLEFDAVYLANDFPELVEAGKLIPLDAIDTQEINLLYVAATRAIEALELNPQLRDFVRVMETQSAPTSTPVLTGDAPRSTQRAEQRATGAPSNPAHAFHR